jgi:hypothetical protein
MNTEQRLRGRHADQPHQLRRLRAHLRDPQRHRGVPRRSVRRRRVQRGLRRLRRRPHQRLRDRPAHQHQQLRAPAAACASPPTASPPARRARALDRCNPGLRRLQQLLQPTAASPIATERRQHCGGCSNSCPTPTLRVAGLRGGPAAIGTCAAGSGDCDGDPTNGCEVNTNTSVQHCGGCGRTCAARANASVFCSAGACGSPATRASRTATATPSTAARSTPRTNTGSCGRCGNVCSAANGTSTCSAGVCGIGACNAGFANCDGNASNGCEVTPDRARPTAARAARGVEVCDGADNDCDGALGRGLPDGAVGPRHLRLPGADLGRRRRRRVRHAVPVGAVRDRHLRPLGELPRPGRGALRHAHPRRGPLGDALPLPRRRGARRHRRARGRRRRRGLQLHLPRQQHGDAGARAVGAPGTSISCASSVTAGRSRSRAAPGASCGAPRWRALPSTAAAAAGPLTTSARRPLGASPRPCAGPSAARAARSTAWVCGAPGRCSTSAETPPLDLQPARVYSARPLSTTAAKRCARCAPPERMGT